MGPQALDYIETVLTCKGNYYSPDFKRQLSDFHTKLEKLLVASSTDKSRGCSEKEKASSQQNELILKKVEPWNSVKVTFNIPIHAARRLQELARRRDPVLRNLGILAVEIEGDRVISLTLDDGAASTSVSKSGATKSSGTRGSDALAQSQGVCGLGAELRDGPMLGESNRFVLNGQFNSKSSTVTSDMLTVAPANSVVESGNAVGLPCKQDSFIDALIGPTLSDSCLGMFNELLDPAGGGGVERERIDSELFKKETELDHNFLSQSVTDTDWLLDASEVDDFFSRNELEHNSVTRTSTSDLDTNFLFKSSSSSTSLSLPLTLNTSTFVSDRDKQIADNSPVPRSLHSDSVGGSSNYPLPTESLSGVKCEQIVDDTRQVFSHVQHMGIISNNMIRDTCLVAGVKNEILPQKLESSSISLPSRDGINAVSVPCERFQPLSTLPLAGRGESAALSSPVLVNLLQNPAARQAAQQQLTQQQQLLQQQQQLMQQSLRQHVPLENQIQFKQQLNIPAPPILQQQQLRLLASWQQDQKNTSMPAYPALPITQRYPLSLPIVANSMIGLSNVLQRSVRPVDITDGVAVPHSAVVSFASLSAHKSSSETLLDRNSNLMAGKDLKTVDFTASQSLKDVRMTGVKSSDVLNGNLILQSSVSNREAVDTAISSADSKSTSISSFYNPSVSSIYKPGLSSSDTELSLVDSVSRTDSSVICASNELAAGSDTITKRETANPECEAMNNLLNNSIEKCLESPQNSNNCNNNMDTSLNKTAVNESGEVFEDTEAHAETVTDAEINTDVSTAVTCSRVELRIDDSQINLNLTISAASSTSCVLSTVSSGAISNTPNITLSTSTNNTATSNTDFNTSVSHASTSLPSLKILDSESNDSVVRMGNSCVADLNTVTSINSFDSYSCSRSSSQLKTEDTEVIFSTKSSTNVRLFDDRESSQPFNPRQTCELSSDRYADKIPLEEHNKVEFLSSVSGPMLDMPTVTSEDARAAVADVCLRDKRIKLDSIKNGNVLDRPIRKNRLRPGLKERECVKMISEDSKLNADQKDGGSTSGTSVLNKERGIDIANISSSVTTESCSTECSASVSNLIDENILSYHQTNEMISCNRMNTVPQVIREHSTAAQYHKGESNRTDHPSIQTEDSVKIDVNQPISVALPVGVPSSQSASLIFSSSASDTSCSSNISAQDLQNSRSQSSVLPLLESSPRLKKSSPCRKRIEDVINKIESNRDARCARGAGRIPLTVAQLLKQAADSASASSDAASPVIASPATASPATVSPVRASPATVSPVIVNSATASPATGSPVAGGPIAASAVHLPNMSADAIISSGTTLSAGLSPTVAVGSSADCDTAASPATGAALCSAACLDTDNMNVLDSNTLVSGTNQNESRLSSTADELIEQHKTDQQHTDISTVSLVNCSPSELILNNSNEVTVPVNNTGVPITTSCTVQSMKSCSAEDSTLSCGVTNITRDHNSFNTEADNLTDSVAVDSKLSENNVGEHSNACLSDNVALSVSNDTSKVLSSSEIHADSRDENSHVNEEFLEVQEDSTTDGVLWVNKVNNQLTSRDTSESLPDSNELIEDVSSEISIEKRLQTDLEDSGRLQIQSSEATSVCNLSTSDDSENSHMVMNTCDSSMTGNSNKNMECNADKECKKLLQQENLNAGITEDVTTVNRIGVHDAAAEIHNDNIRSKDSIDSIEINEVCAELKRPGLADRILIEAECVDENNLRLAGSNTLLVENAESSDLQKSDEVHNNGVTLNTFHTSSPSSTNETDDTALITENMADKLNSVGKNMIQPTSQGSYPFDSSPSLNTDGVILQDVVVCSTLPISASSCSNSEENESLTRYKHDESEKVDLFANVDDSVRYENKTLEDDCELDNTASVSKFSSSKSMVSVTCVSREESQLNDNSRLVLSFLSAKNLKTENTVDTIDNRDELCSAVEKEQIESNVMIQLEESAQNSDLISNSTDVHESTVTLIETDSSEQKVCSDSEERHHRESVDVISKSSSQVDRVLHNQDCMADNGVESCESCLDSDLDSVHASLNMEASNAATVNVDAVRLSAEKVNKTNKECSASPDLDECLVSKDVSQQCLSKSDKISDEKFDSVLVLDGSSAVRLDDQCVENSRLLNDGASFKETVEKSVQRIDSDNVCFNSAEESTESCDSEAKPSINSIVPIFDSERNDSSLHDMTSISPICDVSERQAELVTDSDHEYSDVNLHNSQSNNLNDYKFSDSQNNFFENKRDSSGKFSSDLSSEDRTFKISSRESFEIVSKQKVVPKRVSEVSIENSADLSMEVNAKSVLDIEKANKCDSDISCRTSDKYNDANIRLGMDEPDNIKLDNRIDASREIDKVNENSNVASEQISDNIAISNVEYSVIDDSVSFTAKEHQTDVAGMIETISESVNCAPDALPSTLVNLPIVSPNLPNLESKIDDKLNDVVTSDELQGDEKLKGLTERFTITERNSKSEDLPTYQDVSINKLVDAETVTGVLSTSVNLSMVDSAVKDERLVKAEYCDDEVSFQSSKKENILQVSHTLPSSSVSKKRKLETDLCDDVLDVDSDEKHCHDHTYSVANNEQTEEQVQVSNERLNIQTQPEVVHMSNERINVLTKTEGLSLTANIPEIELYSNQPVQVDPDRVIDSDRIQIDASNVMCETVGLEVTVESDVIGSESELKLEEESDQVCVSDDIPYDAEITVTNSETEIIGISASVPSSLPLPKPERTSNILENVMVNGRVLNPSLMLHGNMDKNQPILPNRTISSRVNNVQVRNLITTNSESKITVPSFLRISNTNVGVPHSNIVFLTSPPPRPLKKVNLPGSNKKCKINNQTEIPLVHYNDSNSAIKTNGMEEVFTDIYSSEAVSLGACSQDRQLENVLFKQPSFNICDVDSILEETVSTSESLHNMADEEPGYNITSFNSSATSLPGHQNRAKGMNSGAKRRNHVTDVEGFNNGSMFVSEIGGGMVANDTIQSRKSAPRAGRKRKQSSETLDSNENLKRLNYGTHQGSSLERIFNEDDIFLEHSAKLQKKNSSLPNGNLQNINSSRKLDKDISLRVYANGNGKGKSSKKIQDKGSVDFMSEMLILDAVVSNGDSHDVEMFNNGPIVQNIKSLSPTKKRKSEVQVEVPVNGRAKSASRGRKASPLSSDIIIAEEIKDRGTRSSRAVSTKASPKEKTVPDVKNYNKIPGVRGATVNKATRKEIQNDHIQYSDTMILEPKQKNRRVDTKTTGKATPAVTRAKDVIGNKNNVTVRSKADKRKT